MGSSNRPFMRFFGLFLWLSLCSVALSAQILDPIKWQVRAERVGETTYDLLFTAVPESADWHLYSQYTEEGGPLPTEFTFEASEYYSRVGKVEEESAVKSYESELFDGAVVKEFKAGNVEFTQRIEVRNPAFPVVGYVSYMTCDATRCMPPKDFEFAVALAGMAMPGLPVEPIPTEPVADNPPPAPETPITPADNKTTTSVLPATPAVPTTPKPAPEPVAETTPEPVEPVIPTALADDVANHMAEPLTWRFEQRAVDATTYDLIYTVDLAPGWHTYSQTTAEGGPMPTEFTFTSSEGVDASAPVVEETPTKTKFEELFGVDVTEFTGNPVVFRQRVTLTDPNATLTGYATAMACEAGRCLPPTPVDFSFTFGTGGTVAVPTTAVAVDGNAAVSSYAFDQTLTTESCGALVSELDESDKSFWGIYVLGFIGGLLALLTPCVFPMIPLTVSFFTKSSENRATGIRNALIYSASIIAIYVSMGLLITGIFGADALNALSVNPYLNIGFGLLFLVFAVSFFGYFEITLPSSWANATDGLAAKSGGLLGIFFMAFTLSLVSFSCTGPIIGSLLVESASGGSQMGPATGMLGFASALALPFGLFAAFPGWLNSLPRSGGWMTSVKVVLGFVEIALAMKFFSTADLLMNTKWMPYELFVGIWVLTALGLGLYLIGQLRFPHDSPLKKIGAVRGTLAALAFGFAAYCATGFMYNERTCSFATPSLLSGLAPPAHHSYIYDKTCFAGDKDFASGFNTALETQKPILLDFTGHGCVNCRKMEDNVWTKDGVYELINDEFTLISLYVDERTKLETPYVSEKDQQKKRTIGAKWADFEATHFNRNSQPYYVLIDPRAGAQDLKVLNKPRGYTPDKDEYQAWLECGLARYQELNPSLSAVE